ncbi:oxidoreductase [Testudinibacter sp. TR-2022]|uniref:aldo/keto reductase n=1 Tax=Testudinibacter sp. TR-2022 TaxID=2585029 RepID=UPI001118AAA4|nr:aldo/keto reductase [Testudinibacter sp. TR-2022]TNH03260.1 oxidoreductase [Pasteurellaceae bacterium Phil31]TNH10927.1 oxidoreductase [Testudinibacter sp. TR-2022]TNH12294.1 oxidoreductase [Testudinibacter sp. TR-2022]TNH15032.1 oxidoreductase [Testudinibacter sp. TR-2022]TNH20507.1 oxidoreductase [Testudinibacter sp. TR-2022]
MKTAFQLDRLVHGYWRLKQWNLTPQQLLQLTEQVIELGIRTFDHAACYGSFTNEEAFGQALKLKPSLRHEITLITKCGILFPSQEFPTIDSHYYDNSYEHIVASAERSIAKMQCDYLDVLLIHRLSPCVDPEQVAKAFEHLHSSGKVRYFGVSNYTPSKFSMLQSYLDQPLLTNQIEISPLHLAPFDDGTLDYLMEKRIRPMAWSPLAGGELFNKDNPAGVRVRKALLDIGQRFNETHLDTLAYAWLLSHPAKITPVIGSGELRRIQRAVDALSIQFSEQDWIEVYKAAQGHDIP